MAVKLPNVTDLGQGPSLRVAYSPMAAPGGEYIARGAQQLAAGIEGFAKAYDKQEKEQQEFEARAELVEFENRVREDLEARKQKAEPDARGFSQGFTSDINRQAAEIYNRLPRHLKPEMMVRLRGLEGRYGLDAKTFEDKQRTEYTTGRLDQSGKQQTVYVAEDPNRFEEIKQRRYKEIEASGLPPAVQEAKKREVDDTLAMAREQGRMKDPTYAKAAATGQWLDADTTERYLGWTRGAYPGIPGESSNNPTITNKIGAFGWYQFLEGTAARVRAEAAKRGIDLPANYKSWTPAQQHQAAQIFTSMNAARLSQRGVPVTPVTLRMAHFFGADGAADVYHGIDKPLPETLSGDAIRNNPQLARQTGRQIFDQYTREWAQVSGQPVPEGQVATGTAPAPTRFTFGDDVGYPNAQKLNHEAERILAKQKADYADALRQLNDQQDKLILDLTTGKTPPAGQFTGLAQQYAAAGDHSTAARLNLLAGSEADFAKFGQLSAAERERLLSRLGGGASEKLLRGEHGLLEQDRAAQEKRAKEMHAEGVAEAKQLLEDAKSVSVYALRDRAEQAAKKLALSGGLLGNDSAAKGFERDWNARIDGEAWAQRPVGEREETLRNFNAAIQAGQANAQQVENDRHFRALNEQIKKDFADDAFAAGLKWQQARFQGRLPGQVEWNDPATATAQIAERSAMARSMAIHQGLDPTKVIPFTKVELDQITTGLRLSDATGKSKILGAIAKGTAGYPAQFNATLQAIGEKGDNLGALSIAGNLVGLDPEVSRLIIEGVSISDGTDKERGAAKSPAEDDIFMQKFQDFVGLSFRYNEDAYSRTRAAVHRVYVRLAFDEGKTGKEWDDALLTKAMTLVMGAEPVKWRGGIKVWAPERKMNFYDFDGVMRNIAMANVPGPHQPETITTTDENGATVTIPNPVSRNPLRALNGEAITPDQIYRWGVLSTHQQGTYYVSYEGRVLTYPNNQDFILNMNGRPLEAYLAGKAAPRTPTEAYVGAEMGPQPLEDIPAEKKIPPPLQSNVPVWTPGTRKP